jgi:DNA-binding CsgD family transcriptional regulator
VSVVSPDYLLGDLARLTHRSLGVRDFALGATRILARAVPFDGICLLTMDPATLLPTGEVVENGLPPAAAARMAEIEIEGEDFNTFDALARSGRPAASLSEATDGDLDRSLRHRELKRPNGFGDELRAALVDDATWGGLTLLRESDRAHFTPAESALVASLSRHLADGLRRTILFATALSGERRDHHESAGVVLLARDNSLAVTDAVAEMWLADLSETSPGHPIPPVVTAVASRARSIVDGRAATGAIARARVRTASGLWLVVRGSILGEDADASTAVIIEPARPHDLAPLIADAYGLTDRERAVTELVAQGLQTSAIADRMHISPWTVQDHLKSIFEKVEVSNRGELVARIFFEHHAPRLADGYRQRQEATAERNAGNVSSKWSRGAANCTT